MIPKDRWSNVRLFIDETVKNAFSVDSFFSCLPNLDQSDVKTTTVLTSSDWRPPGRQSTIATNHHVTNQTPISTPSTLLKADFPNGVTKVNLSNNKNNVDFTIPQRSEDINGEKEWRKKEYENSHVVQEVKNFVWPGKSDLSAISSDSNSTVSLDESLGKAKSGKKQRNLSFSRLNEKKFRRSQSKTRQDSRRKRARDQSPDSSSRRTSSRNSRNRRRTTKRKRRNTSSSSTSRSRSPSPPRRTRSSIIYHPYSHPPPPPQQQHYHFSQTHSLPQYYDCPPPSVTQPDERHLYTYFFTKRYPFSNHYPCQFLYKDHTYNCTEQFYMYEKAKLFNDESVMNEILGIDDPKQMKHAGRKVAGFVQSEWDAVSRDVMWQANFAKYTQNCELRLALFATAGTELVETNPTDQVWGIGLSMDDPRAWRKETWRGQNLLGQILTEIRDTLMHQSAYAEEISTVVADRARFMWWKVQ